MQIFNGVRTTTAKGQSVVTIGNFDGVHIGHQALVKKVISRANEVGAVSTVITFEPHPVKVLYPDRQLKRIFGLDDQCEQLERLGIDVLVIEPFSREFSQLEPERFLTEWIYRPFNPESLIVGYDFSFGANRKGSIDYLTAHASSLGFRVEVVQPVKVGDVLVSSSRIRQALEEGEVGLVTQLLRRRFYVDGIVERGAGRGRKLGIPTANLHTSAELLPARGVYIGRVRVGDQWWKAAVNVGFNPTFQDGALRGLVIEAHLIDFAGDLYGHSIRVEFIARIRDEKKFASVDELVAQIQLDIDEVKSSFCESSP